MGYVGRADAPFGFPECFNEESSGGVGGSRAHRCSRPPGKRGCLLNSENFGEQKDQAVVLRSGKEAMIPCCQCTPLYKRDGERPAP